MKNKYGKKGKFCLVLWIIVTIHYLFLATAIPIASATNDNIPASLTSKSASTSDTGRSTISKATIRYVKPPFKIASFFSRLLQTFTGLTPSSEIVTDYLAQRILKRKFGGKISVVVKTYSLTDLCKLKVKRVFVRMNGSHYKDIPLGNIEIESKTPFWLLLARHKHIMVHHPALLSFKMQLSEQQLDRILHSETVSTSLRILKLDLSSLGPGLDEQKLQMHEPEVSLNDDSIMVKTIMATPGADPSTAVPLTIFGRPKLHGEDCIYLEEVNVESPDITEPRKFSKFVEHLINPLVNLRRFDKVNFAIRLDQVSIKSKQLSLSGRILVGPKPAPVKSP